MPPAPEADALPALQVDGAVATITLRRPNQANRIGPPDLAVLKAHLAAVDALAPVRVLCIRAIGKSFCAGFDLGAMEDDPAGVDAFAIWVDQLEAARPITVAVIEGGVFGGGTDIGLACDFRVGSPAASACMPAARLGIVLYEGALRRYVSRLGVDTAKRMLLAAVKLDASEMLAAGFLTDLVPSDTMQDYIVGFVRQLGDMAPRASLLMKRHLNAIARGELDRAALARDIQESRTWLDAREGLLAWKERRRPVFRGS